MTRVPTADPLERAREQALRLLEVRARSRRELTARLAAKGFSADLTEALLDRFEQTGLLDDERFAKERARAMLRSKGWGPRKLRADLARSGITVGTIEAAIAAAYEEVGVDEIMRREVVKKFGEGILGDGLEPAVGQKAFRFLLGRGFEPEAIRELLGGD